MKKYMIGLGILSFVLAIFTVVFLRGGFLGIILGILSGLISSGTFFGIAIVIDNQEKISYDLQRLRENANLISGQQNQKNICENCGKRYGSDYTSCPFCGHRPN